MAVGVEVWVGVIVGNGVLVHEAEVAEDATEVKEACCSGEGPHAVIKKRQMSASKELYFTNTPVPELRDRIADKFRQVFF